MTATTGIDVDPALLAEWLAADSAPQVIDGWFVNNGMGRGGS